MMGGGEGGWWGGGGDYEWGREIPSAVLKVNTNALWPHQSAGLLFLAPLHSFPRPLCAPLLWVSPLIRPSVLIRLSALLTLLMVAFSTTHPPRFFSRPACLPALWISFSLRFFTLMARLRNDPRLCAEPFSLPSPCCMWETVYIPWPGYLQIAHKSSGFGSAGRDGQPEKGY